MNGRSSGPNLREALLPRADLELGLPPSIELVALELPAPERVLELLGSEVDASLDGAVAKRRAEFAAGRHAATLALSRLGCTRAVPRRADGIPDWPPGFVGSISHTRSVAVAAVARAEHHRGLGLDVEQLVSAEQRAELTARILCHEENELLGSALSSFEPRAWFSLGFSSKESLYKCLNPLCGEFFDFHDARLTQIALRDARSGELELTLMRSLRGGFEAGFTMRGVFTFGESRVATAFVLDHRAPLE